MKEEQGAMGDQADTKHVQAPIPSLAEEVGSLKSTLTRFVGCHIEIFLLIEVLRLKQCHSTFFVWVP